MGIAAAQTSDVAVAPAHAARRDLAAAAAGVCNARVSVAASVRNIAVAAATLDVAMSGAGATRSVNAPVTLLMRRL